MYFDTGVISETLLKDIMSMFDTYGTISRHNEQSLLNLAFYQKWQPVPAEWNNSLLYVFVPPPERAPEEYTLVKYKSWEDFHARKGGDGKNLLKLNLVQEH